MSSRIEDHDGAARLPERFSPRARAPVRRGVELAAALLSGTLPGGEADAESAPSDRGTKGLRAEVLSTTPRSIVLRLFTTVPQGAESPSSSVISSVKGRSSVVVKHFRRRDGASNSGGFGYLRARWGAEVLPGAARVLAADDEHRLIISEDLSDLPILDEVTAQRSELVVQWIRSWPELTLAAGSTGFEKFCTALVSADAVAAKRGDGGVMASRALLKHELSSAEMQTLTRREGALLWWGDPSPRNIRCDSGAAEAKRRFRQVDVEGSGWCDPALLVAEVRLGLPQALPVRSHHGLPEVQRRELAQELAEHWSVPESRIIMAERGIRGIIGELRGGP